MYIDESIGVLGSMLKYMDEQGVVYCPDNCFTKVFGLSHSKGYNAMSILIFLGFVTKISSTEYAITEKGREMIDEEIRLQTAALNSCQSNHCQDCDCIPQSTNRTEIQAD